MFFVKAKNNRYPNEDQKMFACGGKLTAGAGIALKGIACSVYTAG